MSLKSKNAMRHGAWSADCVLPGESADEFFELVNSLFKDFAPTTTIEEEIVRDLAATTWKKRRANIYLQLALLQTSAVNEIEESEQRTVKGIQRHLNRKRCNEGGNADAVAEFSESIDSLEEAVRTTKSHGKVGASLRSVRHQFKENLEPLLKHESENEHGLRTCDFAPAIDALNKAIDLEARLNSQIEKAIKRFVLAREFQLQYGPKIVPKLAKPLVKNPSGGKALTFENGTGRASDEKAAAADDGDNNDNDNDNNNNNNNNDNDNNQNNNNENNNDNNNVNDDDELKPRDFDWEHEYDDYLASKKRKEKKA